MQEVVIKTSGTMDEKARFVLEKQLKNRLGWKKTVEVFSTQEDSEKGRWRGEYFGKQMRGAALMYMYTQDEELYDILTDTVLDLLSRQDEYGRFSTYNINEEFRCWDIWCRKYVLVGLQYYYKICKDLALKTRIIDACQKHLDYIIKKIGPNEDQISITTTSNFWGCVNSCTILEPTVEMYKLTGEKRYLEFAEYIISTGGCSDCNLIELAIESNSFPYQYPVTKAYEMMSFYEGILAYYEATGEKKYFDATVRFMDLVANTDITIIGCAGCTHEFFDNSSRTQTEYNAHLMQETCVTVTWMRVNRRLFDLTGDVKYMDRLEIAGYNALYGSLNTEMNAQFCEETNGYVEAMAFDSYSPLYMNTRGRGVGGFNEFASGGYNGCCVAIGACGIALMPLSAVLQENDKIYINMLFNGEAVVRDKTGKMATLTIESSYPENGFGKIIVDKDCSLTLYIRKPAWVDKMLVNGVLAENEYIILDKNYHAGEEILLNMETCVKAHILNGKVAFTFGFLTLASDEQKSERELQKPVRIGIHQMLQVQPEDGEIVRFICDSPEGKLVLSDFQSCGKKWLSNKPLMTVWFNMQN